MALSFRRRCSKESQMPQIIIGNTGYDEDALRDATKLQLAGPARDRMCY